MGADVRSRRLQARTKEDYSQGDKGTARAIMWRYGGVSHRVEARAGVTNAFMVEEETTAVELTECRSTEEGLTSTTSNTLLCECPNTDQGGAVNEGTCGRPLTDDSSEQRGEQCREVSDGNDAIRENGDTEFTRWTRATESTWDELYTDRTTPTRRRPAAADRWWPNRNRRIEPTVGIAVARGQRPGGNWVRAGDVEDDRWKARIHECCHTARRADDARGPPQDTTFATPTTRSLSYY